MNRLLFLLAFYFAGVSCSMTAEMKPDDITIDNYKEFEAQLRRDLPLDTPIGEVKRYLDEREIGYSFGSYTNSLYVLIPEIYRELLLFTTDLQIKFQLDPTGEKLIAINVSLPKTGP